MNMKILLLVAIFSLINLIKTEDGQSVNIWTETGRTVGLLIKDCWLRASNEIDKQFFKDLKTCLKLQSLRLLQQVLKQDVIELYEGVKFVRHQHFNGSEYGSRELEVTNSAKIAEEDTDWKSQVMEKIKRSLETHVLKIRLNNFQQNDNGGRGRRRRNSMMPLLVFGTVAMGMVLIPMGFQFLAVLGGKALLLAKMALILTSIQGLKKIATSNVNYGLYRTDPCKNYLEECIHPDNDVFASVEIDGFSPANDINYFGDFGHVDSFSHMNDFAHSTGFSQANDYSHTGGLIHLDSFDYEDILGHYDRQWPFNAEGHSYGPEEYHDFYGPGRDLLHPMDPRYTPIRDKISV